MAGILSGEYIFNSISPAILLLTVLFLLAVTFFLRRSGTVQSLMLMFTVYLTGICSYRTAVVNTDSVRRGYYEYDAVVASTVKQNHGYSSFDLIKISQNNDNLKLKATIKGNAELYPGDRLHIHSKLYPPEDRKNGRFSYASYLRRSGYAGTTFLNPEHMYFEGCSSEGLSPWTNIKISLLQMRTSVLSRLHTNGLEGKDFATVSAMAFGDKTFLTSADREAYNRTGVSHVLALSGLHISIIYAFLTFLLSFLPKVPRFLTIQTAVWFYVVFAGMSPSLIRAALMITVYSAGTLMHRDKIAVNSLSLAGTVSLLLSPQTIFDICFQLSFLSVFSIMLFYRPLTKIFPSRPFAIRKVMQMTAVSVAAYIGTLPLILYNFGNISFCFVITNLLVVPLTSIVIYLAIFSLIPFVGIYITYILSAAVHLLNLIVSRMGALNFAGINDAYISLNAVIFSYIIIICTYFIYNIMGEYKKD